MTITVVVFSIVAALILALLAAVIFSVVCVGFALIILFPTLFFTTAGASFIWLFGVGAYYILKWFNKKEIPGIHKPLEEGMGQDMGLDALTGDKAPPEKANGHAANGSPKGRVNGQAKEGKKDGVTGKVPGGQNWMGWQRVQVLMSTTPKRLQTLENSLAKLDCQAHDVEIPQRKKTSNNLWEILSLQVYMCKRLSSALLLAGHGPGR